MIRSIFVFLFLAAAGPAAALSCMPATLAQAYDFFNEAPESYVVVVGQFAANPVKLRETSHAVVRRYRFTGKLADRQGYHTQLDTSVDVTLDKPDPMLDMSGGHVFPGTEVLAFLQKSKGKYLLSSSDCSSTQFYNPTSRDKQKITSCISGRRC
ncbi:MAG: hypothetical protein HRU33_07990 [Rhodobacteraceae bacterium]|nr:hypothetical protein [Paracoccaceae bacterium]